MPTAPSGAVFLCLLVAPVQTLNSFRVQSGNITKAWSTSVFPMKLLIRLLALILFVVFFDFALKNTDEVVLHFFWGSQTRSPLIILLLTFFIVGVVMGVLAMITTVLRYRRELARYKKEINDQKKEASSAAQVRDQPPPPEHIIEQVGL